MSNIDQAIEDYKKTNLTIRKILRKHEIGQQKLYRALEEQDVDMRKGSYRTQTSYAREPSTKLVNYDTNFSSHIHPDLNRLFEQYCEKYSETKSDFLRSAFRWLCDRASNEFFKQYVWEWSEVKYPDRRPVSVYLTNEMYEEMETVIEQFDLHWYRFVEYGVDSKLRRAGF